MATDRDDERAWPLKPIGTSRGGRCPSGISGLGWILVLAFLVAALPPSALSEVRTNGVTDERAPDEPTPTEVLEGRLQNFQTRLQSEGTALATVQEKDASVVSEMASVASEGERARDDGDMAQAAERAASQVLVQLASEVDLAQSKCVDLEQAVAPRVVFLQKLGRDQGILESLASRERRWRQSLVLKQILSKELDNLQVAKAAHQQVAERKDALEKARDAHSRRLNEERQKAATAKARHEALESLHQRLMAERREHERNLGALAAVQQDQEKVLEALKRGMRVDVPPEPDVFAVGHRGKLAFPTRGFIEVAFGKILDPRFNTVTFQNGLDIRAPKSSPVVTVSAGRVVYASFFRGYGNLVIVDHGQGYHSLYAHLEEIQRQVGDEVLRGESLGKVGETGSKKGAFLHFELRRHGRPVDPNDWFGDE